MPALKFLATVFHDTSGELVTTASSDEYSKADSEATQLTVERGTSEHTGYVYKQLLLASPNKAWAVSVYRGEGDLEVKIVTDCVTWKEALDKAFPGYVENLENIDDYKAAQEAAFNQDWDFACEVIDETKL